MKNLILSALLLPTMAVTTQAATLNLPEVPAAKEQAASANKPAIIIWYGSDWQVGVDSFVKDWQAAATKHAGTYVFGQFDDKTGLNGEVRKKALPIEHFNIPVVVLLSQNGTFMAEISGKELKGSPDAVISKLAPLAAKAGEFNALVDKATKSKGSDAVNAAGAALSMLPIKDAMRCKLLTNILNKEDPKDTSGYVAQFCLDHLGMYREVRGIMQGGKEGKLSGKERKFDEAEAYVRKVLNSAQLKGTERRQQWLAGLSYVQRERILSNTTPENRDISPVLATLDEIIKLAPTSQYGIGAKKFRHYWDPSTYNTITTGYYNRGDQTLGFEKDWHVDVTSSIKGAGTYTFTLDPVEKGGMVSRNFRLAVNGKVVHTPNIPADQNTKTVDFEVPAIPKGAKVEVWLTAKCSSGWMDATGFIRMVKK